MACRSGTVGNVGRHAPRVGRSRCLADNSGLAVRYQGSYLCLRHIIRWSLFVTGPSEDELGELGARSESRSTERESGSLEARKQRKVLNRLTVAHASRAGVAVQQDGPAVGNGSHGRGKGQLHHQHSARKESRVASPRCYERPKQRALLV